MNDAFARWLHSATAMLAPGARARAQAELITHYQDAIDAYCAQGHSMEAAERMALADLGDARATAHTFAATGAPLRRLVHVPIRQFLGSTGGRLILMLVTLSLPLWTMLLPADRHSSIVFLQTSMLALLVCVPLAFDDLDLSGGVVALMGTLLAQPPHGSTVEVPGGIVGTHSVIPVSIGSLLLIAALAGGVVGLINGSLASVLRRPVAHITAITAVGLALVLNPHHARHHSVWSAYPNGIDQLMGSLPVRYVHERTMVEITTIALFAVVLLLVVYTMLRAPHMYRDPVHHRLERMYQSSPMHVWRRIAATVTLLPFVLFLATLNNAPVILPSILLLAVLVSIAVVIIGNELAHPPARRWFTNNTPPGGTTSVRILRLVICSALTAVTGTLITGYGMRDNTYAYAASFLIIVPLASLVVGGQHALRGRYRLIGGIVGSMCLAALMSAPNDYKLNDDSVAAIVLAALAVVAWRWVLRPQQRGTMVVTSDLVAGEPIVHLDIDLA